MLIVQFEILSAPIYIYRLPWWLRGKESTCNAGVTGDKGLTPWVGKMPWRRKQQPTPVFLPGESYGQRRLASYSPWGRRVRHDWSDLARSTAQNRCTVSSSFKHVSSSRMLSSWRGETVSVPLKSLYSRGRGTHALILLWYCISST